MSQYQMEMIALDELVSSDHMYRRFMSAFDFPAILPLLRSTEKSGPHKGYGVETLFKCLLLQFMEDVSDRELERLLAENNAAKWFCGFSLCDKTPDHTVFSRARSRIGTKTLSQMFATLREQLREAGYISDVFTFVDASHLVSKASLWEERDEAIRRKYEKLNNATLPKIASDTQARIGNKGGKKYWYGYKKHVSTDMRHGFINKVAVTPANVPDAEGFKHVCPQSGAVYADKGYCIAPATTEAARKNVALRAIKRNNMKDKNRELDRWISGVRAPFEGVFSKQRRRVRYKGVAKNQFSEFFYAMCFNLRRMLVIQEREATG